MSTVGQNSFSRFRLSLSFRLPIPACASAGLPGFWAARSSLHPFGPILLPRSSYNLLAPAVRYSLSLLLGATSVRSLLEIPRHGVSCYHGTESLGARGPLLTEGLRRYRHGTEPPDTCLLNMLHWGAHGSLSRPSPTRLRPATALRTVSRVTPYGSRFHSRSPHREAFV